jgi:hypothetical protein
MTIPATITILVERLNYELNQIEQEAIEALELVRINLERFPNNFTLVQLYAFLNTSLFFVANFRLDLASIEISAADGLYESDEF